MTRLLAIAAVVGLAWFAGHIHGRHEVMSTTVVRVGSPFYLNKSFFGECWRSKELQLQACATSGEDDHEPVAHNTGAIDVDEAGKCTRIAGVIAVAGRC